MLLTSHSADRPEEVSNQGAVLRCLLRRTALVAVVGVIVLLIWGVASGPTPRDATLAPPNLGLIEGGDSPIDSDSPSSGDELDSATTTFTRTR